MHLSDGDSSQSSDRNSNYRYHNFCALHFSDVLIIECEFETFVHNGCNLFRRSSYFDVLEDAEVDQSLCRMINKNI